MKNEELLEKAIEASKNAYSPYSKYCVGVALLTKNEKIYTGCNVENHGIQSICGERVAFSKAFSEGENPQDKENYVAMMIIGHEQDSKKIQKTLPCGYCRQFISEFVNDDFKILTYDENEIFEYKFSELLPHNFKLER